MPDQSRGDERGIVTTSRDGEEKPGPLSRRNALGLLGSFGAGAAAIPMLSAAPAVAAIWMNAHVAARRTSRRRIQPDVVTAARYPRPRGWSSAPGRSHGYAAGSRRRSCDQTPGAAHEPPLP